MAQWWEEAEFREQEQIIGFRQTDFDPEDDYHAFVDACDEWWYALPEADKIAIWAEYVYDM